MTDATTRARVTIELDRDLALSLFEWSYQFMTDQNPMFRHPADAIGIDQLSGELERTLSEPFEPNYARLLAEARARAVQRYRSHMGERHSSWLDGLAYQELDEAQDPE